MNKQETIEELQETRTYLTRRIDELDSELEKKKRQLARVENWLKSLKEEQ